MIARRTFGTLFGVAASTLTIIAIEAVGHRVAGIPQDPARFGLPLLLVLAAWLAGTAVGGLVGTTLARWSGAAWVVAGLVALGVVATSVALPTPWWLTLGGIVLPLVIAWLIARRASAQRVAL